MTATKKLRKHPKPIGSASYIQVQYIACKHSDSILLDDYKPTGGKEWCDECGEMREYRLRKRTPADWGVDCDPHGHDKY